MKLRISAALALALLLPAASTAWGAGGPPGAPLPASGDGFSFSQLGQATQTLNGPHPSLDFYIPGPDSARAGRLQLHVVYTAAPLVDARSSSASVYVNGVSVAGQTLSVRPAEQSTLDLALSPAGFHQGGFNHVQVVFTLNDHGQPYCTLADPNLYITVYGWSSFTYVGFHPLRSTAPAELQYLPDPFAHPAAFKTTQLTVGLPAIASHQELTGAATVLARFGEDSNSTPPAVVSLAPPALAASAAGSNLLLVGTPGDNPALRNIPVRAPLKLESGSWRDLAGHPLPQGEGLILESQNPWDQSHVALAITGNGQSAIRRAAMVLSSGTLRRLLHGTYALVPSEPHLPPQRDLSSGVATLRDLGYTTLTLQGSGDHEVQASFDEQQRPTRDGKLDLLVSHSATAVPSLSSLRVDLNGQPLASRSFNNDDPQRFHWTVAMPPDQLQLGMNAISIHVFLGAPGISCSVASNSSLWGEIFDSSTVNLPAGATADTPDLHLMPFPLVVNGSPDDTVLVVPDRTGDQSNALEIASLIGAHSRVDAPRVKVLGAREAGPGLLKGHVVVLDGTASANPLVRRVAPYLPLRAAPGLRLTGQTSTLDGTVREHGSVGIVEEFQSPWTPGKAAIVFSATEPTLLSPVRHDALRGNTGGTVAIVDAQGKVQSFNTTLVSPEAASQLTRPVKMLTAAGILALLMIVALTVADRRREREIS